MPPRKAVDRRIPDPRLDHLHECVEAVKSEVRSIKADLQKNTEVTEQVRDILATFRVTMTVGKWMAAVGAGAGGVLAVIKGWRA